MQEQEEEDGNQNNQEDGDNGTGIRLGNRRGKKQQKGGVDRSNLHKKVITTGSTGPSAVSLGSYDEKDVSSFNSDRIHEKLNLDSLPVYKSSWKKY